ncbi:MAG: DoxX family protein [Chloroflexi bacterium]|nr:MAG: DoxX family protein [Chloroflexota bacterium]
MVAGFLIGRILLGLFFLMNAVSHFSRAEMLTGYAASKGVPAPRLAVLGTGVLLLIGSLSILTGFQPVIGVIALVLFFLPVTFMMHNFWAVQDEQTKMMEMVQFMKNMALLGAVLTLLAIPQPWPFSLG